MLRNGSPQGNSLEAKPEEKTQPQPLPDREEQDEDPPTVALFKARLAGLAKPARQAKPKTPEDVAEDVRKLREKFPEQFEKWNSWKQAAAGGAA